MKPIRLEFAAPVVGALPWAAFGLAALLSLGAVAWLSATQAELAQVRQRLASTQARPAAPVRNLADEDRQRIELEQARAVFVQIGLPWEALLNALEAASQEHIALLGVEPDAGKRTLRLTAEASDLSAMLDYARHLATLPQLRDVHLESHQVQAAASTRPVRFVLAASWVQDNARGRN